MTLGDQVGCILQDLQEDLKGKTQLEEPYVDRNTLLRAVREQNRVIIDMQECIVKMQEREKQMLNSIDVLVEKTCRMEKYSNEVENMLSIKIPLVDKMNDIVQKHDATIDEMSSSLKHELDLMSVFRKDAKGSQIEMKDKMMKIAKDVKEMPQNIIISSRQVMHPIMPVNDTLIGNSNDSDDIYQAGGDYLVDIISREQEKSLLLDEQHKCLEEKLNDALIKRSEDQVRLEDNVNNLVKWKTDQSSVDLVTIRQNHHEIQRKMEDCENALSDKVSTSEIETKLQHQFEKIIEYLNKAMDLVENDEKDFRSVADALNQMLEILKETKADRADVTSLRHEFIQYQVLRGSDSHNEDAPWGFSIDNEDIRQILTKYTTIELVERMIEAKLDRDTAIPRFEEIETMIKKIKHLVNQIAHIETAKIEGVMASSNIMNLKSESFNVNPTMMINQDDTTGTNDLEKGYSIEAYPSPRNRSNTTVIDGKIIDMKQGEGVINNDQAQRSSHAFPSSSIVKGSLGDIYRASKVKVVIDNDTRLHSNSRGRASHEEVENKPLSASGVSSRAISILPDLNEDRQVTKRHTLPSILTAGSKTMSPRPKSGSKRHSDIVRSPKPLERIGKPLSKIKHGRQYSVTSNKKIKTNVTVT